MSRTPTFSVVVPLVEHRGLAAACLDAWGRQTLPRDDYELLAVTDRSDPAVERAAVPLLGPGGRLVTEAGAGRSRLYDLGARSGRGRFVFLTESHCVPEPDCLAAMAAFLAAGEWAGACCRSVGVARGWRDRQDHALFDEGFDLYRREGDWRKVNVHGFALLRETYEAVGGLPWRFGGFAEMLLAAALRDGGHRLGYAEASAVRHHYRASLREVEELIEHLVAGESLYREARPGRDVGFTFVPHDLLSSNDRAAAWLALAGVQRRRLLAGEGSAGEVTAAWTEALRSLTARWRPSLARSLARLRFSLPFGEAARARAYRVWGEQTLRKSRMDWLARKGQRPPPASSGRVAVARLADQHHAGLHAPEVSAGETFRWTAGAALVRLTPVPGASALRLVTNGLHAQPFAALRLRVYADGRPVAAAEERDGVRVTLDERHRAAGVGTVALCCAPVRPWERGVADRRELGLPVFALEFEG